MKLQGTHCKMTHWLQPHWKGMMVLVKREVANERRTVTWSCIYCALQQHNERRHEDTALYCNVHEDYRQRLYLVHRYSV